VKFIRDNLLLNELILVDGIGRSGKVMLAEILTGLERVEKQDYHEFLEYIPLAYKYNKISKDMAISILQTQMDTELYKNMIGRSINNRPTDYTSLYKFHSPHKYLKRQIDEDGPIIADKVLEERPIYLNWCHDLIQKSDIIFEAFKNKVKIIYINRRPIDIIYEWNQKNFGERIANDPTEMQYIIEYNQQFVPELAVGWEDEYLSISALERIVRMIYVSFKRNLKALQTTKFSNQVMVINFEDLVTKPDNKVIELSSFVNSTPLSVMKNILVKENCPRILLEEEFNNRKSDILDKVKNDTKYYIEEMESIYLEISKYMEIGVK